MVNTTEFNIHVLRWFQPSHESRVTGWNNAKKTNVLECGLYLELCGYECSSGSEAQNQGRWIITSDIGYTHNQGALVLLSVNFMAAGVRQSSKSQCI